jgi:hypothetical protein
MERLKRSSRAARSAPSRAVSPPGRRPNPNVTVRIREPGDLPACVAVLRRVHQISGYPSRWPEDPGGWITPAAWWPPGSPSTTARSPATPPSSAATDSAAAHGLQPVLDVVADSRPAIALYEQAG